MKTRPVTTGQAASDDSAIGIRLSAALPMGWANSVSSDVNTSGM